MSWRDQKKRRAYEEKNRDKISGYQRKYLDKTREHVTKAREPWTTREMDILENSRESDTSLSIQLGRSIKAIQVKRYKINKSAT